MNSATAHLMNPSRQAIRPDMGLRWFQSLQVKLALVLLILLGLLAAASYFASRRLVASGLETASIKYESEVSRRLGAEIDRMIGEASDLAETIVLVTHDDRIAKNLQNGTIEAAAGALAKDSAIRVFGIWPEPASTAPGSLRDSAVWVREGDGRVRMRADYNDPDTIPYWRESWYTPARLVTTPQCYWTPRYKDLLTHRDVVTCVRPLTGSRGFQGAVTVSLDLEALSARFAALTAGDSGYALLIDRNGQLLAMSKRAQEKLGDTLAPGRNVAELAQKVPKFNPLTIAVHDRNEKFFADAVHSSLYDARQISQIKDNTRDLSRTDAESVLGTIWNHAVARAPSAPQVLDQSDDPVLGETGYAVLASLPGTDWQLASVTPSREGQDSVHHLLTQALLATLAAVALTLLIAFIVMRGAVLSPLRRMVTRLSGDDDSAESASGRAPAPITLDQSSRNELGALAHWFNERGSHLRELNDRAQSASSQLVIETSERQRLQEALVRTQDRSQLALATIDDAVVLLDERQHIEHLNPQAEQILGVSLPSVRGTPFAQSFKARVNVENGESLPDPVTLAIQRGAPVAFPDGILLTGNGLPEREVFLAVTPAAPANGRPVGSVVTIRRLDSRPSASHAEAQGAVTGLGGRNTCEKRLRALIESAHRDARCHALLVVDIQSDGERGRSRVDDAIRTRLAVTLAAWAGGSDRVFDLPEGRFGITLEQVDAEQVHERAGDLLVRIAATHERPGEAELHLHGTVGIGLVDATVENAMEALRRGDTACDAALRTGGGVALLYHADQVRVRTRNDDDELWVQRIRRGLDHNQFHVTTQMVSPSRTRAAEGQVFEALVTLEDEEGFWASPEQFLPVAVRNQLSAEIDRWVVSRVVESLAANVGLCARVAFCGINLSTASVADPAFLDFIVGQINAHPAVPVGKLCFEVDDDLIAQNPPTVQRFCEALRVIGCRITIQQRSGRQITSIDQLRRLPIDFVKMDAKRFPNLAADHVDQTIAESLIQLSQMMKQRVIVTHIDSEANATIWRRLGADYLQGYAIAKPSPVPFTGAA